MGLVKWELRAAGEGEKRLWREAVEGGKPLQKAQCCFQAG